MSQPAHVPTNDKKNDDAADSKTTATAENLKAGVEMGKKDAQMTNDKAADKKEDSPKKST